MLSDPTEDDPCECDSLVKFQKKVEDALQALTKKYILYNRGNDVWREVLMMLLCTVVFFNSLIFSLTESY